MNEEKQDELKNFQRWLSGIPYEVAFWRSYYGNKKRRNDLFKWSCYDKPCALDDFDIGQYILSLNVDKPKLVDVGCALSYMFSGKINGKDYTVDYLDPLAPFYNKILRRFKINRPQIKFGMIESLVGTYPPNTVDFIHVRNALDHCSNPLKGIIQSLVILKKGGVLYLHHHRNEAENEAYRGFHQFNITEKDGDLILWNKECNINVTSDCKDFADIVTTVTPKGEIVAVITKKNDVPALFYNPDEVAISLTIDILATVEYFHSFGRSAKYQVNRLVCTIGHSIMRLVPYSILNKIKRIAGK